MTQRGSALALAWLVFAGCASMPAVMPTERAEAGLLEPIRYVALGDSYTIGTSVAENERFPNQLVERLRESVELQLVGNLAVNGYTTSDLIRAELPPLAELRPDFVTLLIGVNDVVQGVSAERYRSNVDQILGAILAVVARDRIVVVSTPDYTRTPRGADYGDPAQQRAAIADFNRIMGAAAEQRGIAFVDIGPVADRADADPMLVAGDQLHPSSSQYAQWVERIAPVVIELFE